MDNLTDNRIQSYLARLDLPVIEAINPNDGIFPYYQRFLAQRFPPGLYALDCQRTYTPIDSGHYGLFHLVSVPREPIPVYGVTLFKNSKVFHATGETRALGTEGFGLNPASAGHALDRGQVKYSIIFAGCIGTRSGNRFLSSIRLPDMTGDTMGEARNQCAIIPTAGAKPEQEVSFLFTQRLVLREESLPREQESSDTSSEEDYGDDYGCEN